LLSNSYLEHGVVPISKNFSGTINGMAYRHYRRKKPRYRRRSRKQIDPLFSLIIVLALAYASNNAIQDGILTGGNLLTLLTALLKSASIFLVIILIFAILITISRKYLEKFRRLQLYKMNRSLGELQGMDPKEFEHYVAAAFEQQGYSVEEVTPYAKDHGIDVVLRNNTERYAVQVKRYSEKNYVQEKEVRDFLGSYISDKFDGGFFITTGYFSKPAKQWAIERGMNIIDGAELVRMVHTYDNDYY